MQYYVTDIPTAYPVYELNFEDHLIPVLEGVHEIDNVMTLGRHGLFLNNSMDDNVRLGFQVADHIEQKGADGRVWVCGDAAVHEVEVRGQVIANRFPAAPVDGVLVRDADGRGVVAVAIPRSFRRRAAGSPAGGRVAGPRVTVVVPDGPRRLLNDVVSHRGVGAAVMEIDHFRGRRAAGIVRHVSRAATVLGYGANHAHRRAARLSAQLGPARRHLGGRAGL